MPAKTKKRPQTHMDERMIEDPDLEYQLGRMFELAEAAREYANAQKEVKRIVVEVHDLKAGEMLRCGEYVLPGVERSGGDYEIPRWTRIGVGKIASDSGQIVEE